MTFSKMLAAYGDEDLTYQNLDDCFKSVNWKKGLSQITFVTDQPFGRGGTDKIGLILWFDREKLGAVIEEMKKEKTDEPDTP